MLLYKVFHRGHTNWWLEQRWRERRKEEAGATNHTPLWRDMCAVWKCASIWFDSDSDLRGNQPPPRPSSSSPPWLPLGSPHIACHCIIALCMARKGGGGGWEAGDPDHVQHPTGGLIEAECSPPHPHPPSWRWHCVRFEVCFRGIEHQVGCIRIPAGWSPVCRPAHHRQREVRGGGGNIHNLQEFNPLTTGGALAHGDGGPWTQSEAEAEGRVDSIYRPAGGLGGESQRKICHLPYRCSLRGHEVHCCERGDPRREKSKQN